MTNTQKYLLIGGGVLLLGVGVYAAIKYFTKPKDGQGSSGTGIGGGAGAGGGGGGTAVDDDIDSVIGRKVYAQNGLVNVRSEPKVDNGISIFGQVVPVGDNIIAERGGLIGTVKSTTTGENNYTWYLVTLASTVDVEGGAKEGFVREDVVRLQ